MAAGNPQTDAAEAVTYAWRVFKLEDADLWRECADIYTTRSYEQPGALAIGAVAGAGHYLLIERSGPGRAQVMEKTIVAFTAYEEQKLDLADDEVAS